VTPSSTTRSPRKAASSTKKPAAQTNKPAAKREAPAKSASSRKAPARKSSGSRKPPAPVPTVVLDVVDPSELVAAVEAFLESRREASDWSPRLAALGALAVTLATELAGRSVEGSAGIARELRATLDELAPRVAPDDQLGFLASSSTPVE
jgi:hypothetical protein